MYLNTYMVLWYALYLHTRYRLMLYPALHIIASCYGFMLYLYTLVQHL
jgi:hypothetical protein